jgi:hypothetical protein
LPGGGQSTNWFSCDLGELQNPSWWQHQRRKKTANDGADTEGVGILRLGF